MIELSTIESFLTSFGLPVGLLLLTLWLGAKGHWVFGTTHRQTVESYQKQLAESRAREEEWKSLALRGGNLAATALNVVQATVQREG